MVMQDKFNYTGKIGRYEIQDGTIRNLNEDSLNCYDRMEKVICDYQPGDKDALFKKLISLEQKSEHAITDFYNTYGALEPYRIDEDSDGEQLESLDAARRAIFYFKMVFKLEVSINSKDCVEIRDLLEQLFLFYRKNPTPKQYYSVEEILGTITNHAEPYLDPHKGFDSISDADLFNYAQHLTSSIINTHIKKVRPWFKFVNGKRSCSWKVHSGLLGAIYFDYYLALCKDLVFRMCANPTCPNPVEIYGSDTRKVFCSNRCANTVSKRRIRELKRKGGQDNG